MSSLPATSKSSTRRPGGVGVQRWLISCDESGTGGAPYFGYDTWTKDRKLNIWQWTPNPRNPGSRTVQTEPVLLKYPLRPIPLYVGRSGA
jgi:hypothetical protein